MVKIAVTFIVILILGGCASDKSMGSRGVHGSIKFNNTGVESVDLGYGSGTDVEGGISGDMVMHATKKSASVMLSGQSGPSKASAGHEATVDAIEATGEAVSKTIEAAGDGVVNGMRRGFAP